MWKVTKFDRDVITREIVVFLSMHDNMIWLDMIPFANLSNDISRAIYRFNKILSYIADKTEIIDRLHPF